MTLRTYRLNSKEEPTDELLDKLMAEVGKAIQEESRKVNAVLESRMKDVSRQVTELKKPVLCIVAGPNGAGKTSTTNQLLKNEWSKGSLYINPDNIAQEIYGDWNSHESIIKAAQDATDIRYKCFFYICTQDPTINVRRVAKRYLTGGHEVPISKNYYSILQILINAAAAITIADRAYLCI